MSTILDEQAYECVGVRLGLRIEAAGAEGRTALGSTWGGDTQLIRTVSRTFRPERPAAVAAVTREGDGTATAGASGDETFEIGSISKAITGMLYRDAAERGVVSPTTTLRELLPLDDHGQVGSVTLHSLAIHRSGLPGLPPGMRPLSRNVRFLLRGENPYGDSLAELLDQTRNVPVGAPRARYSNLGFQLLGHAVAAAEGRTFAQLLHDSMGVEFSAPSRESDLRASDVIGHGRWGRPAAAWIGEAVAPAGGIRASVVTMRDFLRSVIDGTAPGLSALEPTSDFTPQVGIGAGWITVSHRGRPITWHNGSTGGFSSWIGVDRAAGVGLAVLSARHSPVDRQGFRLLTELTTGTNPNEGR